MDKTEILNSYEVLINACTSLHDVSALANLYYTDINQCMRDAIADKSVRMYETLNMDVVYKRLNDSFIAIKRNMHDINLRQEDLKKDIAEYYADAKKIIDHAESICKDEEYNKMYTPSLISLGRIIEGSTQFSTEAKRLEYFTEQCLKEVDKMNMLRDSMRKSFMIDLSNGTFSNIQDTDFSQYEKVAFVLEDMQNNNKHMDMLKELKQFAIQQNKDFSRIFSMATECKEMVRETSYNRIREDKIQEMMVQDVGREYDGPTLE